MLVLQPFRPYSAASVAAERANKEALASVEVELRTARGVYLATVDQIYIGVPSVEVELLTEGGDYLTTGNGNFIGVSE